MLFYSIYITVVLNSFHRNTMSMQYSTSKRNATWLRFRKLPLVRANTTGTCWWSTRNGRVWKNYYSVSFKHTLLLYRNEGNSLSFYMKIHSTSTSPKLQRFSQTRISSRSRNRSLIKTLWFLIAASNSSRVRVFLYTFALRWLQRCESHIDRSGRWGGQ